MKFSPILSPSLVFATTLFSLTPLKSHGSPIAYESFNYEAGTDANNQSGGVGWLAEWSAPLAAAGTIVPKTLIYEGTSALPGSGNAVKMSPAKGYKISRDFSKPVTSGDFWVSYLYSNSNPSDDGVSATGYSTLRLKSGESAILAAAGANGAKPRFSLEYVKEEDGTLLGSPVTANQVYLVTVHIEDVGSKSSRVSVYLNDNFETPDLTGSTDTSSGITGVDFVWGDAGANFEVSLDEIRVGTTQADVAVVTGP